MPDKAAAVAEQVDYRLAGSAIARVRWELHIDPGWKRNPEFYVDQTLGAVQILLLQPAPFSAQRQHAIVTRMEAVPATLQVAKENLTDARQPFAQLAIEALDGLPEKMKQQEAALSPHLTDGNAATFSAASARALAALTAYRQWLQQALPAMRKDTAIGRDNYIWLLRNVAVLPYSPEDLLSLSKVEWSRAVAFESYEQARDAQLPPIKLQPSQHAQIELEARDEQDIRDLLTRQHLLTVPEWMKHYHNLPLPDYVAPFEYLTVTDDLTGPDRLNENGMSYIRVPSPNLGFFNLSTARDPRPIIAHEGIPGHYFQLSLSWANPDPIRRHYYDSGANEGIGSHVEEMMLQTGLAGHVEVGGGPG